jgi:hypothetical protein
MNLVEVHVIGSQAAKALVELEKNGLPGEAAPVGVVSHLAVEFRGEEDVFAAGIFLQESPRE